MIEGNVKKVSFWRTSRRNEYTIDGSPKKVFLCGLCSALVTDKLDHMRWHQNQIQLIVDVIHGKVDPAELAATHYEPVVAN